ncbi:MAG: GNAT family N-acetyltransferase [Parvularculaceae bacterium]
MKPPHTHRQNPEGFEIDDDARRIDLAVVHGFLANSYWAGGIPREIVERAVVSSWCFGVYAPQDAVEALVNGEQVGFARLVTDYATFAYLADVFVLESYRGRGLSKWLMDEIFALPVMAGLRRIMLATRTAHGLYEKSGFKPLAHPEWFMEVNRPEIYQEKPPT